MSPYCACAFFLMIRRPPRSTLFPTRRSSDLGLAGVKITLDGDPATHDRMRPCVARSGEHTSELQSHSDLVCRLLLVNRNSELIGHCGRVGDGRGAPPRFPLVRA